MSRPDPERWLKRSWWQRFLPLRLLRRLLYRRGIGYVVCTNDMQKFWQDAMLHAPVEFRWFGQSLSPEELNAELGAEWSARTKYQPGDRIWPFIVNPDTWAMRLGYVIVRDGQPVDGVITIVS